MKRLLVAMLLAVCLGSSSGCALIDRVFHCRPCGGPRCGGRCPYGSASGGPMYDSGPPSGAVAYPYYSNRGPRDFLVDNPPSIGP